MFAQINLAYIRQRPLKLYARLISYFLFEGRPLTTRGRWINYLVFLNFKIGKRFPQLRKIEKPIFILGTGRSGTTVLGIVLSMHKDIGFLNEPKALWHAVYEKEDLIGSYTRVHASYRLATSEVTNTIKQSAHCIFGAYLAITCSKRVVDKYPELIFRVPFVKKIFPDAKFLFLVRNGWDTCHSIESWSARLGQQKNGEIHDWWGVNHRKWNYLIEQLVPEHADLKDLALDMKTWTNHVDMAAVEWIITMREGLRQEKENPNQVLRITYESLCSDPRGTMNSIVRFCELSECDEMFFKYALSILHPVKPKKSFTLAKSIQNPFMETMEALGY